MTTYTIDPLGKLTAPAYAELTFPRYRPLLGTLRSGQQVVAQGAQRGGRPVGLALAEIRPPDGAAEVLSLYVTPDERSQGIGTALLASLEQALARRGCPSAWLTFLTGRATTPALERLLARAGWRAPSLRMLIGRGNWKILQAPWLHSYRLPVDLTICSWSELHPEEQTQARSGQGTIVPLADPNEEPERINSLGLRRGSELVGWIVTHRVAPDTIRYSGMYVQEKYQRMGRAIGLAAEAIRRQKEALGLESRALFAVWANNTPMVQFLRRRLGPYLEAIEESRESWKRLDQGSPPR